MNYFEFLLYIFSVISVIDIIRWAITSIKCKEYIQFLTILGGDWKTSVKVRHYIEVIILIICLSWNVWKYFIN